MTATRLSDRGLGGIGQPAELLRPVTLDGLVVIASSGSPDSSGDGAGLRQRCEAEGWSVVLAGTTDAASWASAARKTSLVVVTGTDDRFLLDTVTAVRRSTTSALAVLGRSASDNRRKMLAAGADVVLPLDLEWAELRLHLIALLRRAPGTWEPQVRCLASGPLVVDLWARSCAVNDGPIHLSRTEYELLVFLMHHPRQALPIEKIIAQVWQSRAYQGQLNAARIAVSRLRTKLSHDAGGLTFIQSVRGIGYEFIQPVLELGDGSSAHSGPELGNLTLSTVVLDIAQALRDLPFSEAAGYAIETTVAATGGEAGAIFSNTQGQIELLAQCGHPDEYLAYLSRGMPLKGRSQVHALDLRQPTQVDEIGRLARSSRSVQIMMLSGFHSYLYVPLVADGRAWGGLRLASRATRPFDPVVTTFCSAVGAMLSLKLPAAASVTPLHPTATQNRSARVASGQ